MNGIQSTVQQNCCYYNNCNNNQTQIIDSSSIVNHFIGEYYRNTSNIGWNASMYLFDHHCIVICKNKHIGNFYDFLCILSTDYIKRANYDSLRSTWMGLSNNIILINMFGRIQFVGFNGALSTIIPFTETFVLSLNNKNISCTYHMIDF